MAHIGNLMAHIGNVMAHKGNVMAHKGNVMAHMWDVVAQSKICGVEGALSCLWWLYYSNKTTDPDM
jgi:hypothetical protein